MTVRPSAPPLDEGYYRSPGWGMKHPRPESPFSHNVRMKTEEMEAISGLVEFADRPPTRNYSAVARPASPQTVTVAIPPFQMTPAPATRPPRPPPPRIMSQRAALSAMPRPHPLGSGGGGGGSSFTCLRGTESTQQQPSAALGAPPRDRDVSEEEEGELPDIPKPATSPYSDITIMRLVLFFTCIFYFMYIFVFSLPKVYFFSCGNIEHFLYFSTDSNPPPPYLDGGPVSLFRGRGIGGI